MEKEGWIVFWEMANGHKHSFLTQEENWGDDDNIASGYEFKDGRKVKTQKDYYDYVMEAEYTYLEGCIEELELTTKENLEEAKEKGWISNHNYDMNNLEIEFF